MGSSRTTTALSPWPASRARGTQFEIYVPARETIARRHALQEFRTAPHAFDVVITDLQMPKVSGLDLVRSVCAIRADIPVAVASGYPAERSQDADAPSVVWIPEPPTLTELSTILRGMMKAATPPGVGNA
jgi:CheY-like chemotaxis protein